jgi:hypothetical protein
MIKPINHSELTEEIARAGCFVLNMPNADYHAYTGISKSGLDLVARSPAHYFHSAKREATRAMEIGTAIHTALLEPERFKSDYVLLKDTKDRRASAYKEAIRVHSSELVLVGHEADKVAGMQETVYSQKEPREALSGEGWREVSAFIEDPETGVLMRCRYDILRADLVSVDVKKTRDSRPVEFAKSVFNYRYHVQDAMYSHIFELITGERLESFQFLAVEEEPPHAAMVYDLDEETRTIGFSEYRRDLLSYAQADSSGEWAAYQNPRQTIGLPSWAISQFENELEVEL